jgi:hypothetical protein
MASGGWGRGWSNIPWGGVINATSDGTDFSETISVSEDLDVSSMHNLAETVTVMESLDVSSSTSISESLTITEGLTIGVSFDLVSAFSVTPYVVRADFSGPIDVSDPVANQDPASYVIPGLTVSEVFAVESYPRSVFLITSEQLDNTYTLTVSLSVEGAFGDPLGDNVATFQGTIVVPSFFATAQSDTKVMLTFLATMQVDAALVDPFNYTVTKIDGTLLTVSEVNVVGTEDRHVELILEDALVSGNAYAVRVDSAVHTLGDESVYPDVDVFHWIKRVGPILMDIADFSGEVSSGLLGQPDGQIFFSPAFEVSTANSMIEVDSISLCTRAYDVYEIPTLPDPPTFFTWPPPSGAMADSLLNGDGRLAATAERLGQARVIIHDLREDTLTAPVDGPCDATLVETIDITRAGFLNDSRWETFPALTAGIGAFTTADNLTSIGPGPTQNINLQP